MDMFATLNLSEDTNLTSTDTQMLLERNRPIKIGIISVLGAMITLGNIAVIMVISSSVSGWSRNSRYFLLSLTGADSAFGLVIKPCVSFVEGPDSHCHIVAFFNATIYSTCMYTLATISLERYIAVFYPPKYSSLMTRRRRLLLIAFAWCFPPLLVPISFPIGIIEVHFYTASLVCNPSYSTNVVYTNVDVPDVASRVLVPMMTVYTCWTPFMAAIIYNDDGLSLWWCGCQTPNGFLNCIFYFWINRSFRRKFCLLFQRRCLSVPRFGQGPGLHSQLRLVWDNNNTLQEHCSSVSSTCTLIILASDTPF
uniref:Zgc:162592 n=1 Tax=Hucho hucho TaxID=62062 RepID=A0A4W5Q7N7_9TELE